MKPRIILADPPWRFETWSDNGQDKGAVQHYQTMTVKDIAGLPVQNAAAPDAMLFLWATWPNLKDAYMVGESWGFTYKTLAFIWIKLTRNGKKFTGLGYYTRANTEPCLLFTRGNVNRSWIKNRGVHQIIDETDCSDALPGFEEPVTAQILGHSTKPQIFYERIEQLVDGPYLELFGRRTQPGWTVLGNGVTGNDIRYDLDKLTA
jgi:N6-adenosine-specific RNA methylase IME4